MSADKITHILDRLDGVKRSGDGKFSARCPAHDDHRASLSIGTGDDGRVLMHDHAGCSTEAILAAIGLKMADLFPSNGHPHNGNGNGRHANGNNQVRRIANEYNYCNRDGELVFQCLRYVPKGFKQRRPDGNGGWIWDLQGIQRVLYHLPELMDADPAEWVWIVEGEKDVERLESLGLIATCNAMGAGKWKDENGARYAESLRGRRIAIIPDNDKPGRDHARDVAKSCHGKAAAIRIVELPGVPEKGDVSDCLDAGHTVDELIALVEAASPYEPPVADAGENDTPQVKTEYATELGNAQELVARHGEQMRYDVDRGRFVVWNGRAWEYDYQGQVSRWTKEIARETWQRLRFLGSKPAARHATKMETSAGVSGVMRLASTEAGIPIQSAALDSDLFLLNVQNCSIDLRTGENRPHDPADLCSKIAPVTFDPKAEAPLWMTFLNRIMDKDPDLIGYLQRLFGLCLTGDATVQELFILWGCGANGKSVFIDTMLGMLGPYAGIAPESLLMAKGRQEHPTELADLCGARAMVASETEEGGELRIQMIKRLTGDKTIKARKMRTDFFEFPRTHKLILITNNRPRIPEDSEGVWRRIKLIPFGVVIPEPERDRKLLNNLEQEWPGILNWALAGCLDWQQNGMQPPQKVVAATADYRVEADPLGEFIAERLLFMEKVKVPRADLLAEYLSFCSKAKEKNPLSRQALFDRIRRLEGVTDGEWKSDSARRGASKGSVWWQEILQTSMSRQANGGIRENGWQTFLRFS